MQPTLLSIDETLALAFEIFDDMMAEDYDETLENKLNAEDLAKYQRLFDEQGAAITLKPAKDWEEHLGMAIDNDLYIEVQIGFAPTDKIEDVMVRMLINRDPEEKDCHLLWKRQQ